MQEGQTSTQLPHDRLHLREGGGLRIKLVKCTGADLEIRIFIGIMFCMLLNYGAMKESTYLTPAGPSPLQ